MAAWQPQKKSDGPTKRHSAVGCAAYGVGICLLVFVGFYTFIVVPLFTAGLSLSPGNLPSTYSRDMTPKILVLGAPGAETELAVPEAWIDRWTYHGESENLSRLTLHLALPEFESWRITVYDYIKTNGVRQKEAHKALRQRELYIYLSRRKPTSLPTFQTHLEEQRASWRRVGIYDESQDLYVPTNEHMAMYSYLVPSLSKKPEYQVTCTDLEKGHKHFLCRMSFWACPTLRSEMAFPSGRLAETDAIHAKARRFTQELCHSSETPDSAGAQR